MPALKTPICDFGTNAKDFQLNSTINNLICLNDIKGETGTLIMFICNHCPYVVSTIKDIVRVSKELWFVSTSRIFLSCCGSTSHVLNSFSILRTIN